MPALGRRSRGIVVRSCCLLLASAGRCKNFLRGGRAERVLVEFPQLRSHTILELAEQAVQAWQWSRVARLQSRASSICASGATWPSCAA
eukprot:8177072-Pyramimonas_sp.AAC.1